MFVVGPVVQADRRARRGDRWAPPPGATGFLIYALAPTGWIYFIGMPIFAADRADAAGPAGPDDPARRTPAQGRLQGANQSLQGIASIDRPAVFGLTFAWSVRHDASLHLPGLPS